jgi:hypothetical protein
MTQVREILAAIDEEAADAHEKAGNHLWAKYLRHRSIAIRTNQALPPTPSNDSTAF